MSGSGSSQRPRVLGGVLVSLVLTSTAGGCGGGSAPARSDGGGGQLPPSYQPRRLGEGPAFRPGPLGPRARVAAPISVAGGGAALVCRSQAGVRFGAHIELFAQGGVVLVPAGIGIAPPQRRDGARVRDGRCTYPLRSTEPTGVIEVGGDRRLSLGDLFSIWGQPLSRRRLAGFRAGRGGVRAYIDGRRVGGDPRRLALSRHVQIVLEVGPFVAPHPLYRFAPGL